MGGVIYLGIPICSTYSSITMSIRIISTNQTCALFEFEASFFGETFWDEPAGGQVSWPDTARAGSIARWLLPNLIVYDISHPSAFLSSYISL